MNVPDRVRLPLTFDVPALAAETAALPGGAWVPHFNRDIYRGSWTGVALRSPGGVATQLYPDPAAVQSFADTAMVAGRPAFRHALDQFHCPVMSARLLALGPGAAINEHQDYRLGWEDGEIRVHVAIATAEGVEFVLDGQPVELATGQAWYLDLNRPHRAANRSASNRIHLVVDCEINEWLTNLMRETLIADTRRLS